MNWSQRESWQKLIDLLTEAQTMPSNSPQKTNKLLEAVAYGIGTLICKEERYVQRKTGSKPQGFKDKKLGGDTTAPTA